MDYTNYQRESWCQADDLRIRNVRFAAASIEALERSEPVRLEMVIDAKRPLDQIGLRFEVRDEVGAPLATSCLYGLSMKTGENRLTLEYDLSMLSPARRFFSISTRSDRSVVWTDTLMGEMRRSMMRCTSRWERLVRVR